jgi:hypothetical protein
MAVHPLAYQILCGFESLVKFYNKVEKDMQEVWSEQLACTAARYAKSGALVLSCLEDSVTVLLVYDCYNFKRIRSVCLWDLKFYTTRIEWVHCNTELVLLSGVTNELLRVNIFTGEKLAELRESRDK